jgi:hypothetical protein
MLRLLADENFDHDLVRGTLRRRPELDQEQRVLLTHDVNTMSRFAIERITRGEPMAGCSLFTNKKVLQCLTKTIGEAQRDLLQSFNQHIVVESAMKLRLFRHRLLCTLVQGDGGSVSVHRRSVV